MLDVIDPLSLFSVRATTAAAAFNDPSGAYRGEPGRAVDLGRDLAWRTDGQPYHYLLTTHYEIPCLVEGSVRPDDYEVWYAACPT